MQGKCLGMWGRKFRKSRRDAGFLIGFRYANAVRVNRLPPDKKARLWPFYMERVHEMNVPVNPNVHDLNVLDVHSVND
jgi:hypothetical protein